MRLTYMNHGTPFEFKADKMTKHPNGKRGATMLQVHAELALAANDENVYILDQKFRRLSREELEGCVRNGTMAVQ